MNIVNREKSLLEKYDLIIVGSGFSASFFLARALEILNRKVSILVIEKGPILPHASRVKSAVQRGIDPLADASKFFINANPEKHYLTLNG